MSITLNSNLAAAQNGQDHHVIVDLSTLPIISDIPFTGEFLTEEILNESKANTITHSSGRICTIFKYDSNYFVYCYTDTDRQEFHLEAMPLNSMGGSIFETSLEASICELPDGNIGIIYTAERDGIIYLRWAMKHITGAIYDSGTIDSVDQSVDNIACPYVIKLQDDSYYLAYFKNRVIEPTSGGTYTGDNTSEFQIYITQSGDATHAYFKWRKDDDSWSSEIMCTETPRVLSYGVSVAFVPGEYSEGMLFKIVCTPATYAIGYIYATINPAELSELTIGSTTYTHQTPPLVGGGNPYDVAIDIYAYEITLQNLTCAINDENYEGTGEGVRYGTGTAEHPSVSAARNNFLITLTAKSSGAAGNNITIIVPTGYQTSGMSGGANSAISDCQANTSSDIKKRTSSDFETWSSEGDISLSNVVADRKDNLSLSQLDNGDIWILFDNYDDWYWSNVYYGVSTNNGSTWSEATVITSYDSSIASGKHPELVQKDSNEIYVCYHEESGALHMNEDSVGWPGGTSSVTSAHVYNGKVYSICTWTYSGAKYFIAVVEIDIATWQITRSWTTTSTPHFHSVFAHCEVWWNAHKHAGKYIVISSANTLNYPEVAVLNIDTNTINHYFFDDYPTYGVLQNVSWMRSDLNYVGIPFPGRTIAFCAIDAIYDYLFVVMYGGHPNHRGIQIQRIDLTEPQIPNAYWTSRTVFETDERINDIDCSNFINGDFKLYPEQQRAFLCTSTSGVSFWQGRLIVFYAEISGNWTVITNDQGGEETTMPYHGFRKIIYDGRYIWATFSYTALYGQSGRQGVCRYDYLYQFAEYYEPVLPFQLDDYELESLYLTNDNKLIISSEIYGIIIYDIGTNEWSLYNNDTVPGLTTTGDDYFGYQGDLAYDEDNSLVFAGIPYHPSYLNQGLVAFSIYGYMRHPLYKVGTYTDAWAFSDEEDLVAGYLESDCAVTLDPVDNGIFIFWTHQQNDELSIKWGKETPQFNIYPYIVKSEPIVVRWGIDGAPNTIEFSVTNGHLFDPFNTASVWRNYIKKGYKIALRVGELIGGIEYWQAQGTFIITERTTPSYERGKYPIISIKGEDKRHIWEQMEIIVGVDYTSGQSPEYILTHLIEDDIGELTAYVDIPTFDNTTTLFHQWVETNAIEIIEQIMNRYGYFSYIDVTDVFTCRKISDSNDVDHVYSDTDKLIQYSPDDTFSDYTNKILVTCEGLEYQKNVKYEDTVIKTMTGTLGWWGQKKEKTIWFDEEHKKQFERIDPVVNNLSLKIIESAEQGMMFRLAGSVKENITEWDEDNRYCIVEIEAPDCRLILIELLVAYAASLYYDNWAARTAQAALFAMIVEILGSMVTYNYEIHGYPVGYNKISWQAIATDDDLITEIGKEVIREIEEPLAYYIDEAQTVADYEMMVTKLQRKRIKITKEMHLQDEVGDTITFKHPHSGRNMTMFVTNLTRIIKIAEEPGEETGCRDEIEGWVIT